MEKYNNETLNKIASMDTTLLDLGLISYMKKGKKIYIKPENKGKFNATKKRTGKTTEELTHSKNPLTRRRAIFAQNAKRWKKGKQEKAD